jgi:hypothetical protein
MFAHRPEDVIPRPRPGISTGKVIIAVLFTARQLIALDALHKGQKSNRGYFVQSILPPLLHEKRHFSPKKIVITFFVRMDNWIRHNGHLVVDELHRLKILRAPHPPYSPDINSCDFSIFEDFKRKLNES